MFERFKRTRSCKFEQDLFLSEKDSALPEYHETILVKLLYAVAFFVAGVASFFATAGFTAWLKSSTGVFATFPIQLIVVAFPAYLIPSMIEERIIWRLTGEDGFNSVAPVSLGLLAGYILHFS